MEDGTTFLSRAQDITALAIAILGLLDDVPDFQKAEVLTVAQQLVHLESVRANLISRGER
jgi:hypothetical protein